MRMRINVKDDTLTKSHKNFENNILTNFKRVSSKCQKWLFDKFLTVVTNMPKMTILTSFG